MINLCERIAPYKCPSCNGDMTFFTTKRGIMIDYKKLIMDGYNKETLRKFLERQGIKYFKCMECNRTFVIDWRDSYPTGLTDKSKLEMFGFK